MYRSPFQLLIRPGNFIAAHVFWCLIETLCQDLFDSKSILDLRHPRFALFDFRKAKAIVPDLRIAPYSVPLRPVRNKMASGSIVSINPPSTFLHAVGSPQGNSEKVQTELISGRSSQYVRMDESECRSRNTSDVRIALQNPPRCLHWRSGEFRILALGGPPVKWQGLIFSISNSLSVHSTVADSMLFSYRQRDRSVAEIQTQSGAWSLLRYPLLPVCRSE